MVLCSSTTIPSGISTQLVSFIVPENVFYSVPGVTVWGNCDAEYAIYKNGVKMGGGNTSAASPTLQLQCYGQISLHNFDVISLYATQSEGNDETLNYNIILDQL